ncbi:MAG TPA: hypothetical protein VFE25_15880 [Opitutaceae bacterium]|nr:hypothetical protein [Opitutaceae bacterium]
MTYRLACVLALALVTPAFAEETFTKTLSPQDFAAAGLGKLTPDELATLDHLVHASQSGAVAVAKDQTAKEVAQTVRVQVQAEDKKEAEKKASVGFFDRFKVTLKPGTEVEYTTLEANIVLPFDGYDRGTILTLDNGQRWAVVDNTSDYRGKVTKPVHVRITPGSMGSFFMEIEGSGRPRVKFVSNVLAMPPAKLN